MDASLRWHDVGLCRITARLRQSPLYVILDPRDIAEWNDDVEKGGSCCSLDSNHRISRTASDRAVAYEAE